MAACTNVNVLGRGGSLDRVVADVGAIAVEEVHGNDTALDVLVVDVVLAIDFHDRVSIAMNESRHGMRLHLPVANAHQLFVQISGERIDMTVDVINSQGLQGVKTIAQAGNAQKVDRTVFEPTARTSLVMIALSQHGHLHGTRRNALGRWPWRPCLLPSTTCSRY